MDTSIMNSSDMVSHEHIQTNHAVGSRMKFPFFLIGLLTILFAVLAISPYFISVVLGFLCIWALVGVKQAIQAVSLSVIIKFLNPALYTFSSETGILTWLVIFLAVVRLLPNVKMRHIWFLLPLMSFSLVVASLSIFVSPNPQISLFKLFSFSVVVAAVLIGMSTASRNTIEAWKLWFLSLTVSVILDSIPTFFFPAVGYHTNGRGFQGILNQPQALGAWLAPVGAWLLMGLFQIKRRGRVILLGALVILIGLVISTKARTSAAAISLSIGATFIVASIGRRKDFSLSITRGVLVATFLSFALAILLFISPELSNGIKGFALKGGETNIEESFYSSRGGGIESQWANFLNKPLTGNGFGVYPSGYFPSGIVTVYGIPISAPVEKGFLPTAILEEIGIMGTLFFIWFLISLTKRVTKNSDARWISLFFACLFVNVGEAVLFSVGGIGLYFWLLIGLAIGASGDGRPKQYSECEPEGVSPTINSPPVVDRDTPKSPIRAYI